MFALLVICSLGDVHVQSPHSFFLIQQNIWASEFMPDLVSGIGVIKINKTAFGPRQLNRVEKIGMETEK